MIIKKISIILVLMLLTAKAQTIQDNYLIFSFNINEPSKSQKNYEIYIYSAIEKLYQGNYKDAQNDINIINNYAKVNNDTILELFSELLKGSAFMQSGYFAKAYYIFYNISENKKSKDSSLYPLLLINVGIISSKLNKYESAVNYFNKAIFISNNELNKAFSYNYCGNVYLKLNKQDTAFEYIIKSMQLNEKIKNDYLSALSYFHLANYYQYINIKDSAVYYLNKSINISNNKSYIDLIAENYLKLGEIYINTSENKSALENLKKAEFYANQSNNIFLLMQIFKKLSEIYSNTENYKNSYLYLKKYEGLKDSIFSKQNNLIIFESEIRTAYNLSQSDYNNIKSQTKLNNSIIRQKNIFIGVLIVICIILSLLLAYLIYRYIKMKKEV